MILYVPKLYSIDVISTNVRKCIQKLHIFFVRQVLFSIELIYIIYCLFLFETNVCENFVVNTFYFLR